MRKQAARVGGGQTLAPGTRVDRHWLSFHHPKDGKVYRAARNGRRRTRRGTTAAQSAFCCEGSYMRETMPAGEPAERPQGPDPYLDGEIPCAKLRHKDVPARIIRGTKFPWAEVKYNTENHGKEGGNQMTDQRNLRHRKNAIRRKRPTRSRIRMLPRPGRRRQTPVLWTGKLPQSR